MIYARFDKNSIVMGSCVLLFSYGFNDFMNIPHSNGPDVREQVVDS